MVKVITFGVFDCFHFGHLMLLKQAKDLGDYLIVAVQDDEAVGKYKAGSETMFTTAQRTDLIKALEIVDEAVVYKDVDKDIVGMDFDVFAIGEDQTHDGFKAAEKWCVQNNKRVVRLKYTKGTSSSIIKEKILRSSKEKGK